MGAQAKATLRMSDWVEQAVQEGGDGGIRLCKAVSQVTVTGDLEGQGSCQWLLAYPPDGPASFVGLQTFTGALAGRTGTFVLQTTGQFRGSTAYVTWSVVPGSGTGELAGLSGEGGYEAPIGQPDVDASLDYQLG